MAQLKRSWDASLVAEAVEFFTKLKLDMDPIDWVSNQNNIILQNASGDTAFLVYDRPGVCTAHYYFKTRGKQAEQAGHEFLTELFGPNYDIHVIQGLTPLTYLGARWMTKRLGFKSYGVVKHEDKLFEHFILTRKEYHAQ